MRANRVVRADLNLAVTFLQTARMESGYDPERRDSALAKGQAAPERLSCGELPPPDRYHSIVYWQGCSGKNQRPGFLKRGYALELRFKAARSTVDIDLTVQRVAASASGDQNQIVREMLQSAADISIGGWFAVGPASMDLTAAPYGGSRNPIEARMDERTFAESTWTRAWVTWLCDRWKQSSELAGVRRHRIVADPDDRSRTALKWALLFLLERDVWDWLEVIKKDGAGDGVRTRDVQLGKLVVDCK
jgi:hypothetical protein